jgi:hypothetical protein
MIVAPPEPRIEKVPCLLIGLMAAAGKLPGAPAEIDALSVRRGRRKPTADEAGAQTWVVVWDGPVQSDGFREVTGLLAFRDSYDFHTASDVREIVYLKGPTSLKLIRWLRAHTEGRRLLGSIDMGNHRLYRALTAMGNTPTRIVFEDLR